jgi:hypothetical protein
MPILYSLKLRCMIIGHLTPISTKNKNRVERERSGVHFIFYQPEQFIKFLPFFRTRIGIGTE